jgi:hypothetical protein
MGGSEGLQRYVLNKMAAINKFTQFFSKQSVRRTDPNIWRKEDSVPNTRRPVNYFLFTDALNKKMHERSIQLGSI